MIRTLKLTAVASMLVAAGMASYDFDSCIAGPERDSLCCAVDDCGCCLAGGFGLCERQLVEQVSVACFVGHICGGRCLHICAGLRRVLVYCTD